MPWLNACADDTDAGRVDAAVVTVVATGCGNDYGRGTGTIVGTDNTHIYVLTAAHTVAGADTIEVSHNGASVPATVIAFDPDTDLSIIAIGAGDSTSTNTALLNTAPFAVEPAAIATTPLSTTDARNRPATVVLMNNSEPRVVPIHIVRRVNITTENVYLDGDSQRPGYELRADITTGDSGAPVVVDGRIHAIVWSRSRRTDDRAWAIDVVRGGELIAAQRDAGSLGDVDPTRCRTNN